MVFDYFTVKKPLVISRRMVKVMAELCNEAAETCPCSPENEFGVTLVVAFKVLESIGHLTSGGKAGVSNGQ